MKLNSGSMVAVFLLCVSNTVVTGPAWAQAVACPGIGVGEKEFVLAYPDGEALLIPWDGEIATAIARDGTVRRFRFRLPPLDSLRRADVTLQSGVLLRGFLCTGCLFINNQAIPSSYLANEIVFERGGVSFHSDLLNLMSITQAGGEWVVVYRSGEKAQGRLSLPTGVKTFAVLTEYGVADLELGAIKEISILGN